MSLNKIRKLMSFAIIDENIFNKIKPKINNTNNIMLIVALNIAILLLLITSIISIILYNSLINVIIYLIGLIISILLLSISIYVLKNPNKFYFNIVSVLVHFTFMIFFLYSILLGSYLHPDQPAVTFMVFLVFIPSIFIEKSKRIIISLLGYITLFIITCILYKEPSIIQIDILNVILYGFLGMISSIIFTKIKIQNFALEYQVLINSRCDLLTKINNRNAFELDLDSWKNKCNKSLGCIYIDVNGLHELNNDKGHSEGDKMLKFIAKQLEYQFDEECVYRIGGDEFVVIVIDQNKISIQQNIDKINLAIIKAGYRIAFGYDIVNKDELDIPKLIKTAESNMRIAKENYYLTHDRRGTGRR